MCCACIGAACVHLREYRECATQQVCVLPALHVHLGPQGSKQVHTDCRSGRLCAGIKVASAFHWLLVHPPVGCEGRACSGLCRPCKHPLFAGLRCNHEMQCMCRALLYLAVALVYLPGLGRPTGCVCGDTKGQAHNLHGPASFLPLCAGSRGLGACMCKAEGVMLGACALQGFLGVCFV